MPQQLCVTFFKLCSEKVQLIKYGLYLKETQQQSDRHLLLTILFVSRGMSGPTSWLEFAWTAAALSHEESNREQQGSAASQ